MFKRLFLFLFVLAVCIGNSFGQKKQEVTSPDGNIRVSVSVEGNLLAYDVAYRNDLLLENCQIGMQVNGQNLGANPRLSSAKRKTFKETLNPVIPFKFSTIESEYNQLLLKFNGNYSVELRAYNDGIAYYSAIKSTSVNVDKSFPILGKFLL